MLIVGVVNWVHANSFQLKEGKTILLLYKMQIDAITTYNYAVINKTLGYFNCQYGGKDHHCMSKYECLQIWYASGRCGNVGLAGGRLLNMIRFSNISVAFRW